MLLSSACALVRCPPVLAEKDPEWFEKISAITPADMVAVATTFTKQTVDKVQHGEQTRCMHLRWVMLQREVHLQYRHQQETFQWS